MSVHDALVGVEPASPISEVLNQQYEKLRGGVGVDVVETLCTALLPLRLNLPENEWEATKTMCIAHSIHPLLLEDPYTRRAFEKPRGYAGDAVMLDYVYSGLAPKGTSVIGQQVFTGTTGLSNGKSVIFRRNLLAQTIDQLASTTRRPRILSLACGHLREGQQSQAVLNRKVGALYAIDQDVESLRIVEKEQVDRGVTPVH